MPVYEGKGEMEKIIPRLYEKYLREMSEITFLRPVGKEDFEAYVKEKIKDMRCIYVARGDSCEGALIYSCEEGSGMQYCGIPVFGYFAESEKTLSLLFQHMAEKVMKNAGTEFSVRLYAHDESAIRLFSMLQFGMMSEKCVRKTGSTEAAGRTGFSFRTLSKQEINENWEQVWSLTGAIIEHLKGSPVFYPGEEFTEEGYREFFLSEETNLHAAFSDQGVLAGIIESNSETDRLVFGAERAVNIGEAYVLPEYRGTGLAGELLAYAEKYEALQGAGFSWVEHGTANPNARGFWGKYFTTWQYEMVRFIPACNRPACG